MSTRSSSSSHARAERAILSVPEVENSNDKQDPPFQVTVQDAERDSDPYLVTFDIDDPKNPMNWSRAQRWYLTIFGGLLVLNATFASSAPSEVLGMIEEFKLSDEVATLMISLFVAGYCVGPLVFGPLSEEFGRRPVFIGSFFIYTLFQVAMAVSKNTASILVFRFLGGTFASAPLTNSGALVADIWDSKTRGKALAIFTLAPFAGPALGPTVAGFMYVSGVSWRWLFGVLAIFAGVCWVGIVFTLPETYAPILLAQKARQKRKDTGDDRYYAAIEATKKTLAQQIENVLARPFVMLIQEPMLLSATVYMSFVYGCLYLLFEAYPIVFERFNAGLQGLCFLPLLIGGAVGVTLYVLIFNPRYEREVARCAPNPVPPEFRLEMILIAAPLYAASFFWFAWTSYPSVSFWAPMMAGGLMGFSINWIFLGLFNYIVDSFAMMAASALAANTVVRSLFGAGFPLFAEQMYDKLGSQWASSLLGFIALIMVPIPFVFLKYGAKLRAKSKHAIANSSARSKESDNSST